MGMTLAKVKTRPAPHLSAKYPYISGYNLIEGFARASYKYILRALPKLVVSFEGSARASCKFLYGYA